MFSHENLVDSDMRDILTGSPHEEDNNRSPLSAEAPELSSHSSDEVCPPPPPSHPSCCEVRIHCLRIRIQLFLLMRIWIQLLFYCRSGSIFKKFEENYLIRSFLKLKKTKKIAKKNTQKTELVQVY